MDPPDFWRAQIPWDDVQVLGPRKDASWLEYATATLASRGQVIFILIFLSFSLIISTCLTVFLFFLAESGPGGSSVLLEAGLPVLRDAGSFSAGAPGGDGVWTLLVYP